MTIFWIMAVGLLGLALLFVIPPLLSQRRQTEGVNQDELNLAVFRQQLEELDSDLADGELDRQQYKAARRDLERELLYDVTGTGAGEDKIGGSPWTAVLLGVTLPVAAIGLYLYLGNSSIIPRLEAAARGEAPATHPRPGGGGIPPLEVMVQRLAEKMEQNPENLQGWLMLGRSYFAIGQPERALTALERAYGLAPRDPDVIVAYAEAIAANNDSQLVGKPAELIGTALEIDPQHASARWLLGLMSFQTGEYARAADRWGELITTFDPQSDEAGELRRLIEEARSRAGLPPEQPQSPVQATAEGPASPAAADTPAPTPNQARVEPGEDAATGSGLSVEVALSEPLWPEADVNDTLFVYAKALSGPPMPLAVKRVRVGDLPLTVTLDDSMAMVPAMPLSSFPEVTVGARVSKSGQATPTSGDLEGEVGPVKQGQTGPVKVLIDRVRP